ncbi:MAG: hypothetical protein JWR90_807 [Marmoricola sp.]|nr:hypothetical protein [Marmoricola sp.]
MVLALVAGLLTGCDHETEIAPPRASTGSGGDHSEVAQVALDRLVRAVRTGDRSAAVALAAPGSRDVLGWVADNAASLRVDELSLRYVDDGKPLTASEQADLGKGAWRGTVQLGYRYAGLDTSPARLETSVVFQPGSGAARIASFGSADERSPLWLVDRLSVVRTAHSLVAVAGSSVGRYAVLVARALRQVRLVLPRWTGPLVVEVPRTRAQLDAALQAQPGQYDNIAAVTTTADGSLVPGSPVRVFVNADVFDRLKARGAQVVMSHEATHVATKATFASMPTWLLEGFADYVALAHAGVPLKVAAGQILPQIRKDGLPSGLPTSQDLDPTATGLGATYEEAWLTCRYLAQEYGEAGLIRFYDKVSAGASAQASFRSELGTTQRAFVAGWRQDLARLAGVAR